MIKKIFIFLLILVAVAGGIFLGLNYFNKPEKVVEKKQIAEITGYDYTLTDSDNESYQNDFNELKKILESETIDYELYAKAISKLFINDLYTLKNKKNKYDVGGTEFIYPSGLDNYMLKVGDTLYKYLKDNSDGKRSQTLPEVKEVTIESIEPAKYKVNEENQEYDGFEVKVYWSYVTDLGYDKIATLKIIQKDNLLYIIEKD